MQCLSIHYYLLCILASSPPLGLTQDKPPVFLQSELGMKIAIIGFLMLTVTDLIAIKLIAAHRDIGW